MFIEPSPTLGTIQRTQRRFPEKVFMITFLCLRSRERREKCTRFCGSFSGKRDQSFETDVVSEKEDKVFENLKFITGSIFATIFKTWNKLS